MRSCERLCVFTHRSAPEIYNRVFGSELIKQFDRGEVSCVAFYAAVTELITANDQLTFSVFKQIWSDIFSDNPGFERFVGSIDSRVRKVILSNTNALHFERIAELPIVKRHFGSMDAQVLSFRQGMLKPDDRFFAEALLRCGSLIEETLFIDDMPEYVAAFKDLGGQGIVYNCQRDALPDLIGALSQHGLQVGLTCPDSSDHV